MKKMTDNSGNTHRSSVGTNTASVVSPNGGPTATNSQAQNSIMDSTPTNASNPDQSQGNRISTTFGNAATITASDNISASNTNTRSRRDRPCDACRRRKSRCVVNEGESVCVLCEFHSQECTFIQSPQPRKKRVPASSSAGDNKRVRDRDREGRDRDRDGDGIGEREREREKERRLRVNKRFAYFIRLAVLMPRYLCHKNPRSFENCSIQMRAWLWGDFGRAKYVRCFLGRITLHSLLILVGWHRALISKIMHKQTPP